MSYTLIDTMFNRSNLEMFLNIIENSISDSTLLCNADRTIPAPYTFQLGTEFHSLMIFHVFSLFFRSRRTLPRSTCTWFVHTRCNIVTCIEYHNIFSLCLFAKVHCSHSKHCSSHLLKNSFSARSRSRNSIHILPIINSLTHFSLPARILMHLHQPWLLFAIFFAQ